jgi:hypothetical protein
MYRTILFVACFTALLAQPQYRHIKHFGGKTGLVLVASGQDGLAIATDGAQVNADGTISQAEKLFPIGKEGAVAIAGIASIQDPVGRPVREELDVAAIVRTWTNSHQDASLDTGVRAITDAVSRESNRFFSARDPGKHAGEYRFALIFVGYRNDKRVITGTRYFAPAVKGKPLKTEPVTTTAEPGSLLVFGPGAVTNELLTGKSPALKKFKSSEPINHYRSSFPQSLSAEQFAQVLSTILEAAESPQGKALSHGSAVAPPNKAAVITQDQGFSWK